MNFIKKGWEQNETFSTSICYWHDAKSWFCYNYLSPKGTEDTAPEDSCEFYERRSEYDN